MAYLFVYQALGYYRLTPVRTQAGGTQIMCKYHILFLFRPLVLDKNPFCSIYFISLNYSASNRAIKIERAWHNQLSLQIYVLILTFLMLREQKLHFFHPEESQRLLRAL